MMSALLLSKKQSKFKKEANEIKSLMDEKHWLLAIFLIVPLEVPCLPIPVLYTSEFTSTYEGCDVLIIPQKAGKQWMFCNSLGVSDRLLSCFIVNEGIARYTVT